MVLINNLTIDEINAALLHLQRARTEVVGGTKGSTVQNITISNKGGGSTVDYAPTITALSNRVDKNTDAIESVEDEIDKIQTTLEQLSDNGISSMTFDPVTRQLQINTQDGEVYSCDITSENIILDFDATTNKLTLEMGEQYQEVTLPYINANEKGSANGVATLDENGRVPYSQLPESAMEFLGQWDASTNTPHLQDGTGTNGDFYIVSAGGTVNLGTSQDPHIVTFSINDRIVYEGDIAQWVRLPAGQVSSVNGQSGAVTLTANDIEYSTGVSIKDKIDANAVQSDWNVSDTTSLAYIKNKPTIPASPVQSDWNVTDTTSLAYIKNKPTIPSNYVTMLNKSDNACYNVAMCTGASNVGVSTGAGFYINPVNGFMYSPHIRLGRGCNTESAGIINAQGTCNTNSMICFLNNTGDAYGNGVSIGGGGVVIVGAGESASTVWSGINGTDNLYGAHAGDETLYLASDNAIYLMANVQNGYAGRKTASLSTVTENNVVYGLFTADRFCGNLNGTVTKDGSVNGGFYVTVPSPANTTHYVLVNVGSVYGGNVAAQIYTSRYFINKSDSSTNVISDGGGYGSFAYAHLGTESSPSTCVWLRFSGWRPMMLCSEFPITVVCNTTTAPSGVSFTSPSFNTGRYLENRGADISCTTTANNNVGLAYGSYNNSNMPGTYGNVIQMQAGTGASSRWGIQVAFPVNDNSPQWRSWTNTTTMGAWNTFITSKNISSQHVACADHATSADSATLGWTDCDCGVSVTCGLVRLKIGQAKQCDIWESLYCFQYAITCLGITTCHRTFAVIGQFYCPSNNMWYGVCEFQIYSACAWIWTQDRNYYDQIKIDRGSTSTVNICNMTILAVR